MEAEQILVIILASALAVLLMLVIAIAIYVLKIVKAVNEISGQAEAVAENMKTFSSVMRKSATPAAVSSVAGMFIKKFFNRRG